MIVWRKHRILLLIMGSAFLLVSMIGIMVAQISTHVETFAAENSSAAYLRTLRDTQRSSSNDIVGPAKKNGVNVRRDCQDHAHAIPSPATFPHDLTASLSREHDSNNFRFYSRYPFYERGNSGPQDAFEHEALTFQERHRDTETYSRVEDEGEGNV